MKVNVREVVAKKFGFQSSMRILYVNVTLGGSKAVVHKYHQRRIKAENYHFDNPTELHCVDKQQNMHPISLGRGHTATSLAASTTRHRQEIVKQVAPMNATSGCGASPLIGLLAAETRIEQSDFRLTMARLLGKVRAKTNGAPDLIVLRILCSYVGGTGAGAYRPIAEELIETLIGFGVPVQVEFDMLGSVTFAEVSTRARHIAAAVLPFALAYVLDNANPRQALVTKHVSLSELPPIQHNEVRDALLLVEEVALNSPQFRQKFELIRPNNSTESLFGNVTLRETDFFHGLDLYNDFAAEASSVYLSLIEQARETIVADSSYIDKLEYVDRSSPLQPKPVEHIIASIAEFSLEATLEAIDKPQRRYRYHLFVNTVRGNRFDASKFEHMFSGPAETLEETISRAKLIASLQQRFHHESMDLARTIQGRHDQIEQHQDHFRRIYRTLASGRYGWFGSASKLRTQLIESARHIRALADDLADNEAAHKEVVKAVEDLNTEQAAIDNRLQSVADMLQSFLPEGSTEARKQTIVPHNLDGVFPELVTVTQESRERQAETLRACAALVTLTGLAKIVAARAPLQDIIVDAILNAVAPYVGPPHGGVSQQDDPIHMYILPPMEPHHEDEIEALVRDRQSDAKIAFMHTLVGGANVLRCRFRFPRDVNEIFCGVFPDDLRSVVQSANADLMFPGERSYPALAGIHIGDRSVDIRSVGKNYPQADHDA